MKTVLLTGASGLIGSRILDLLQDKYHFIALGRNLGNINCSHKISLDLTDNKAVTKSLKDLQFDIILHLAALADLEKCEADPELAKRINVQATENLLKATSKNNPFFIYFSTGFVFKGDRGHYTPSDSPDPCSVYAKTKYAGELLTKKFAEKWAIVRLNYPYRFDNPLKHDCLTWMREKLAKSETITLVKDQYLKPIFIDDLVQSLDQILQEEKTGIFHFSDSFYGSWVDLGKWLCQKFGYDQNLIQEISYAEFLKNTRRVKAPIDVSLEEK